MQISKVAREGILATTLVLTSLGGATGAFALDEKSVVKHDKSPWAVFRFAFSAYKKGNKQEAVKAYRYAAKNGQLGARWKLARMYAEGDGVAQDDYEAFKFFNEIVQQDIRPGSPEGAYVSDALVEIGNYLKEGIPGTPIKADISAARDYYMRAAATYRNAKAQYQIGKMFLKGEGTEANVGQAARWFQLAAEKGHAGAEATLGNLLFQRGHVVRGLAMMTAALENASPADRGWIRSMQEEAFALAGESDRRTAMALAENLVKNGLK